MKYVCTGQGDGSLHKDACHQARHLTPDNPQDPHSIRKELAPISWHLAFTCMHVYNPHHTYTINEKMQFLKICMQNTNLMH